MLRSLALLGRHGTWFLAGGLFIGVLLPPLAALLRPALGLLVFVLVTTTFLGIDWPALAAHARRPGTLALALVWCLLAVPAISAGAARVLGLSPSLAQAVVLWAASPPLTSIAAIALLLGLDGALALLLMIAGTLLMPLALPPLVLGLIRLELAVGVIELMARLALFVLSAAAVAAVLRRLVGSDRLRRHALELSGVNVLVLLLFAIAIMDGVSALLLAEPQLVLLDAAVALVASVLLQAAGVLAFSWLPRGAALTVGLVGGNHNMALVFANLGGAGTPDLALFLATVQLPIYLLPAALKPIYRALGAGPPHGAR